MISERDVHMPDCVAGSVAPVLRCSMKSLHRVITPVHSRVGNRETKGRPATEVLGFFVKSDRIIESPHLPVERGQQWLAINKCRVQLQGAFASRDRFIVKTEVTIELARGIVHPERRRIDPGCALQVSERLLALAARRPKRCRKII